jgi:hypothetical protein
VGTTTAISGSISLQPGTLNCFYVVLDIGMGISEGQTLDISLAAGAVNETPTTSGLPQNPTGSTTMHLVKTITGTVYSDEGTTAVSCQTTIRLAIGSTLWGSAAS